jgi:serine/threonine-protein kinase
LVSLCAAQTRKLAAVTVKFFSRRRADGQPSTQFAATIVAMPGTELIGSPGHGADAPNPDTLSPDSLVSLATDSSGANAAVPDVVTDIGGLPSEVPDPSDAPTLSHIGRYALKRQLGSGGIGTVFEAWDPLLSRAVAVKTLQFDVEHSARVSLDGLFLNEARAAASLNHRYIVTIHDAGLSAHGVYIAMERLYGRDLQRALAEGWKPGIEQAVQLVRRVTEALAYAHARGVVHCDIKPANIFLQRRDRPKVLDFGIARIIHGVSLPALEGAVAGSPRYRAPEQMTGGPVDARADLFSLGVVTYELLTGRRAFEGETLAEINEAVLHSDPTPVHVVEPRVPPDLSAIVARMMARSPADRYTCATELAADLRRWMHEQQARQATASAQAPAAAAPKPAHTSRWLMAAAAGLAAAALGLAWWPGRVPPTEAAPSAPATPAAPVAATALPAPTAAPVEAPIESPPAAPATGSVSAVDLAPATSLDPSAPPQRAASVVPSTVPGLPARGRVEAGNGARAGTAISEAAPVPTGQVQLVVSPWAELEVDGADSGLTPPVQRLTLSEGTHTITLRHGDFAPHTVKVQVTADKPVTVRHHFGP